MSSGSLSVPWVRARRSARRASDWLAASKLGLVVMALVVGVGAGLAAAGFRALVYFFT
jgi:hypothetical protein